MTRSPSVTALATGVALIALGVLLVLNADGSIDLRFAYTAPVIVGGLGAILLASGLESRGRGRGGDHHERWPVRRTRRAAARGSRAAPACWAPAACCSCARRGPGRGTRSCGPPRSPPLERS